MAAQDVYVENNTDVDDIDFIESYFADAENMSGNGVFYGVISVDAMTDAIKKRIDTTDTTTKYRYIGSKQIYQLDVPCYKNQRLRYLSDDNGEDYMVLDIIKRPYDIEDPERKNEFVYDVNLCKINKGVQNGDVFVESLDCIGLDVLVSIFDAMFN